MVQRKVVRRKKGTSAASRAGLRGKRGPAGEKTQRPVAAPPTAVQRALSQDERLEWQRERRLYWRRWFQKMSDALPTRAKVKP